MNEEEAWYGFVMVFHFRSEGVKEKALTDFKDLFFRTLQKSQW
jgi:hypothetical protein